MNNITLYSEKLNLFRKSLENRIRNKAKRQTRYSKHQSSKAILITRENINLDGDRWLEEVTPTELLDNKGYSYNYEVLSIEDLSLLADEVMYPKLSIK